MATPTTGNRANDTAAAMSHANRVLVVSESAAIADAVSRGLIESGVGGTVRRAESYLEALGDVGADGPPRAVIARLRDIGDDADEFFNGLRALASTTRLILIARPNMDEPLIPCDAKLLEPVSAAEVARTLVRLLARPDAPHPPPTVPFPPDGPAAPLPFSLGGNGANGAAAAPPHHAATPPAPPPPAPPLIATAPPPASSPPPPAAAAPAPAASVATPASPPADADLGDIDLVEHLLVNRAGLGDLAARVLANRVAMPGLTYTSDPESVPPGNTAVVVSYHNRSFGLLHAPAAERESLESCSAWLGRWLALEHRVAGLYDMAMKDELTGAWNRRYFDLFLEQVLQRATEERLPVTVMVYDIDDFKQYNDRYGHAAGDEILRETARLMLSVIREHDIVARIGGDEFGVVFWDPGGPRKANSSHPADVRTAAQRFQRAIYSHQFPKLLTDAPGTLTISGGLAGFPWDGRTATELLERADACALQSKRQGKNAITFGPGAVRSDVDV